MVTTADAGDHLAAEVVAEVVASPVVNPGINPGPAAADQAETVAAPGQPEAPIVQGPAHPSVSQPDPSLKPGPGNPFTRPLLNRRPNDVCSFPVRPRT